MLALAWAIDDTIQPLQTLGPRWLRHGRNSDDVNTRLREQTVG